MMKRFTFIILKIFCYFFFVFPAFGRELDNKNIIRFDIPDTKEITPTGINKNKIVTGYVIKKDAGNQSETGFLRTSDGEIVLFTAPDSVRTKPVDINDSGVITGYQVGAAKDSHVQGFFRKPDGTMVNFTVPGSRWTMPYAINNKGIITGCAEMNDEWLVKGFFLKPDGEITTFKVPGANYTCPSSINSNGDVAGCYSDSYSPSSTCTESRWMGVGDGKGDGFIRKSDGKFIKFSVPYVNLTYPASINDSGIVAGYIDALSVFIRMPDRVITRSHIPSNLLPYPSIMNNAGVIIGNSAKYPHYSGFKLALDGTHILFDIPKATSTYPLAINEDGMIVGKYVDDEGEHAFIVNSDDIRK